MFSLGLFICDFVCRFMYARSPGQELEFAFRGIVCAAETTGALIWLKISRFFLEFVMCITSLVSLFLLIVSVGSGLETSIDIESKKGDIKVNATVIVESQDDEKIQVRIHVP